MDDYNFNFNLNKKNVLACQFFIIKKKWTNEEWKSFIYSDTHSKETFYSLRIVYSCVQGRAQLNTHTHVGGRRADVYCTLLYDEEGVVIELFY